MRLDRFLLVVLLVLFLIGCGTVVPQIDRLSNQTLVLDMKSRTSRVPRPAANPLTLYIFWGSWCPQCLAELPSIQRLHNYYQNAGLKVVAIAIEDTVENARVTAKRLGLTFDIYVDFERQVQEELKLRKVPCGILFNRAGLAIPLPVPQEQAMLPVVYGPLNWFSPIIQQIVEQQL